MDNQVERSHIWIRYGLCFLGALTEGFDISAAGLTARKFAATYGLDEVTVGVAFSASIFGLLIGAVSGGWAADRFGRRTVLVASFVTFGASSIGTALAPSTELFLLMRFVTGVGLGGAIANLIAVAAEIGPHSSRASRVAMLFSGITFGGGTAALVAMLLPPNFDWRLLFYIGGAIPLLLSVLFHVFLPNLRGTRDGKTAPARALFGGERTIVTLGLWVVCFFTLMSVHQMVNWLPSLLVGFGHTPRQSSLVTLLFNFGGGIGGIVLGYLVQKGTRKLIFSGSYLGILLGLTLLILVGTDLGGAMFAAFVIGFFLIGAQLLVYGLAPTLYPAEVLGRGVGFSVAAGRLGSLLGPLIAGLILSAGGGSTGVISAMLPFILVALLASLVVLSAQAAVERRSIAVPS